MPPMNKDILVQQTTDDYLEGQLKWDESVLHYIPL